MAVCAVLALTACGTSEAGDTPRPTESTTPDSTVEAQLSPPPGVFEFGSEYRFPTGLVVRVSTPDVFQPSENAYPRSERAAAFGIVLYNDGEQPYRLSNFSVSATVGEQEVKQVVDTTRGYNGIPEADRDVSPGSTVRLTLAFAVHDDQGPVRLTLRPYNSTPATAVFRGSV